MTITRTIMKFPSSSPWWWAWLFDSFHFYHWYTTAPTLAQYQNEKRPMSQPKALIDEELPGTRGEICPCRHCQRQCKIFASGVNFSIFTHFLCFFPLKLLKLGEIDGVKFLAWKSGGVNFWTNSMSVMNNYTLSTVALQMGIKWLMRGTIMLTP